MRLDINLATQPYEDLRQFTRRWLMLIAGSLVLALALSYAAFASWRHYKLVTRDVTREQQTLERYQRQQAEDLAILNRPENRDVRAKSQFLNDLIRRKELSWTKIFVDLEKLLPPHLHVVSIRPEIKDDQIQVNMSLAGTSREAATELVRRMENSATFRNAFVYTEGYQSAGATTGPDTLKVQVSTVYVPRSEAGGKAGEQ